MDLVLADIGLNLTHDSFDHDRERVMEDAWAVGVRFAVITGSTLASSRAAVQLVRARPRFLRATAGVHPHHAREFHEADRPELAALIALSEIGAVGECGLDYYRNYSPHDDQERAFRLQLELAGQSGKPVFLHQRDAHAEFMSILREYRARLAGGVAHCFTGDAAQLQDCLDLDLHIGITGWICDERRGTHLRELVRRIPAERLLLETDAPYLLPRDLDPKPRSRRNEPRYLPHVLAAVASARHEPAAQIALHTTQNALRLFGFPRAEGDDNAHL